jgi:hypothetical protein
MNQGLLTYGVTALIVIGTICIGCVKGWSWVVAVALFATLLFQVVPIFERITTIVSYWTHFALRPGKKNGEYGATSSEDG